MLPSQTVAQFWKISLFLCISSSVWSVLPDSVVPSSTFLSILVSQSLPGTPGSRSSRASCSIFWLYFGTFPKLPFVVSVGGVSWPARELCLGASGVVYLQANPPRWSLPLPPTWVAQGSRPESSLGGFSAQGPGYHRGPGMSPFWGVLSSGALFLSGHKIPNPFVTDAGISALFFSLTDVSGVSLVFLQVGYAFTLSSIPGVL